MLRQQLGVVMTEEDQGEWTLAEGQIENQPLYMRLRSNLPPALDKQAFPENLVVTWEYESDDSGLPADDLLQRMERLEDLLYAKLADELNQSHLLVVTTGGGLRQWLWKTRSAQDAVSMFGEALQGEPQFPIMIEADDDPEWEIYGTYCQQCGIEPE